MITAKYINNNPEYSDLEIGKEYEVVDIDVGQSYSYVLIANKSKAYNTIAFQFYENGEPFDFFKDARFNSYLHR